MPGNKWSRLQEATSSIGEALMQITALTESRRYRAAMLDRGTRADELALARIERDNELLVQNRVQQEATWQDQGWTGTPGTQVWTPGQLPVDTGVEQPDLGGLFDRPPTGMGPMGQASMGEMGVDVEPGAMGGMGATYPGPSPRRRLRSGELRGRELRSEQRYGIPRPGSAKRTRSTATSDLWRQWWYSERNGPRHRR